MIFHGHFLVAGTARGALLAIPPLSFWGGYDPGTGRVTDRSHPALGSELSGRILVMPCGRGSSSSSTVLAEAIRLGTAPAGIVLSAPDPILVIGALVARKLYAAVCPIAVLAPADHAQLAHAAAVEITPGASDFGAIITAQ